VVEKADAVNKNGKGVIIIQSIANVGKESVFDLSVFANTTEEVKTLFHNFINN